MLSIVDEIENRNFLVKGEWRRTRNSLLERSRGNLQEGNCSRKLLMKFLSFVVFLSPDQSLPAFMLLREVLVLIKTFRRFKLSRVISFDTETQFFFVHQR